MRRLISVIAAALCCSFLLACNSGHETVVKEEQKAQKEISTAQSEVRHTRVEGKKEIEEAEANGDIKEIEGAKLDATKELAKAENKVDERKIDATEAITDAKHAAGETSGTYQHK